MVVLAGEILKEVKDHVEQGVSAQVIVKGLRRASAMAVNKVKEISVNTTEGNKEETLRRLAATAMSSKLIHRNADFFTKSWLSQVLGDLYQTKLISLSGCQCCAFAGSR